MNRKNIIKEFTKNDNLEKCLLIYKNHSIEIKKIFAFGRYNFVVCGNRFLNNDNTKIEKCINYEKFLRNKKILDNTIKEFVNRQKIKNHKFNINDNQIIIYNDNIVCNKPYENLFKYFI